jgi:lysophospholipase L1-like esterase
MATTLIHRTRRVPSHTLLATASLSLLLLILSACGDSSEAFQANLTYTALGASDAVGIGASPLSEGYVFEIEDELERDWDVRLVNLGIPGAEADTILDAEVSAASLEDADLITLWAGPNDLVAGRTVEAFERDYAAILQQLREEQDSVIVVANVPDLTQLPRFQETPDQDVTIERVRSYNAVIAQQAARFNVPVVDLFSQPVQPYLVSDDGFHPNDEGHQLIADLFLEQIRPLLPQP